MSIVYSYFSKFKILFFTPHWCLTIRKAVSVLIFTSIVHAFACSEIDYCNSLLVVLPKSRLSNSHCILNAVARLIARLSRYSHNYLPLHQGSSMGLLYWLPISIRIEC